VRVGLDKLPDSEAIRGFVGGNGDVLAHELISFCAGVAYKPITSR
jgi:hypothetical protein